MGFILSLIFSLAALVLQQAISNATFKIEQSPINEHKLMLTINRQPIGEWFKEQWEKLRHGLRQTVEKPRKNRGFKL